MITSEMTRARFEALAEAFGGDLARWPQEAQAPARAYQGAHPKDAATILARAAALDALLKQAREPSASTALENRIVASGVAGRRRAPTWTAAAAALALAVGLGAGWIAASGPSAPDAALYVEAFAALDPAPVWSGEDLS